MNLYYLARYIDKNSRFSPQLIGLLLTTVASPAIAVRAATDSVQQFNLALSKTVYAYSFLKPLPSFRAHLISERHAPIKTLGIGCRKQLGTAAPYFLGLHCMHDHMAHTLPLQQTSLILELINAQAHFSAHYAFKGSIKHYQARSYAPSNGLQLQVKYRPCRRVPFECEFELQRSKETSIHPYRKPPLRLTGTLLARSHIHWSIAAQTLPKGKIDWLTSFRVSYPIDLQRWRTSPLSLLEAPLTTFEVPVIHRATLELEPMDTKAEGAFYSGIKLAGNPTASSDDECKNPGELLTYSPFCRSSNKDTRIQHKLGWPANSQGTVTTQDVLSDLPSNHAHSTDAASVGAWRQKKRSIGRMIQCPPTESTPYSHKDAPVYWQVLSLLEFGTPHERRASRASLSLAHQQGKPWAGFYLGKCYYHGIAYPKNLTLGAALCLQSANAGFTLAQKAILCDLLHDQRPLSQKDLARIRGRFQFWIPIIQSIECFSFPYLELCQLLHDAYKAGQFVEKNYLQAYKYGLSIQSRSNRAFDPSNPLTPTDPIRIRYAHLLHVYPPYSEENPLFLKTAMQYQTDSSPGYLKALKKFNRMRPDQSKYSKVVQALFFCLKPEDYREQRELIERVFSKLDQEHISRKSHLQSAGFTEGLAAVSKSQLATPFQRSFACYLMAIQCIPETTRGGTLLMLGIRCLLEAAKQAYPPARVLLTHLLNTIPDAEGRMELYLLGRAQFITADLYAIAIRKLRDAAQGSSVIAEIWANRNFYL